MRLLLVEDDEASSMSIEMMLMGEGGVLHDPITLGTIDQKDTHQPAN